MATVTLDPVPMEQAISDMQARDVVLPDEYYGVLQGLARQHAFSVAGVAAIDQLTQVRDSLAKAIEDGVPFDEWKRRVADEGILNLPNHRLDNIFRTNIQQAYQRARWAKLKENQRRRPYLLYSAINDSRVRPSHLAMDGIIRPVGDPFWDRNFPSNGYRCRCSVISLTEKQAQRRSGQDRGLNKTVTSDMEPDDGWDYNPGEDLTPGIEQAIQNRVNNLPTELANATEEKTRTAVDNIKDLIADKGLTGDEQQAAVNAIAQASALATVLPTLSRTMAGGAVALDEVMDRRKAYGDLPADADVDALIEGVRNALTGASIYQIERGGQSQFAIVSDGWIVIYSSAGEMVTAYAEDDQGENFTDRHERLGYTVKEVSQNDYIAAAVERLRAQYEDVQPE